MLGFENAGKKTLRSRLAKIAAGILVKPAAAFVSYLFAIDQYAVVSTLIAENFPQTVI